jgi:hypothetical protein
MTAVVSLPGENGTVTRSEKVLYVSTFPSILRPRISLIGLILQTIRFRRRE